MFVPSTSNHRWGVILAGGDGVRLRSLTRMIAGDDRPKQFCRLLGGRTLLGQARQRIADAIDHNRTMFVLTSRHQPFYARELADVPQVQMVVQPTNRGTLSAILCTLMRIARMDARAVVAFFPSDHYYRDEKRFMAGVNSAFQIAENGEQSVILVGAQAKHAETEYGWIEPEAYHSVPGTLSGVRRFWEKPTRPVAEALLERGCLWNTFVMVGQVSAFLGMIQTAVPDIYEDFESILTRRSLEAETETLGAIYDRLSSADFCSHVLAVSTGRLSVLCPGDIGWSDLGDVRRVVNLVTQVDEREERVRNWLDHPAASAAAS